MKRASQAERITALKAEVVLRDPYQFKATAGAGVEIIAVAKGAIGLGATDRVRATVLRIGRTGTEQELATGGPKLATASAP
jgi:hypothetical protein